jgi:hypothetical protein
MKPDETMEEFVHQLKKDIQTPQQLGGVKIPETEMYEYFLKGVRGKKFNLRKRTTLRWKKENRTFKKAADKLIKEEINVIPFLDEDDENEPPNRSEARGLVVETRPQRKCFYCGKPGHIAGPDDSPICYTKISGKQKGIIRRNLPGIIQPRQQRPPPRNDAQANLMRMHDTTDICQKNTATISTTKPRQPSTINPPYRHTHKRRWAI